jgi:serine phosphatase RsbU (regulator of sigma subunit)
MVMPLPLDDQFERTVVTGGEPVRDAALLDPIGHYIVIVEGDAPGRRVEMIDTAPITIGRDPQQTMAFADPELSRRHACVLLVNDETVVQDLGSTNGTFIDGDRITAPSKLLESSILRIGSQFLRYERRRRRDVEREEELSRDLLKASRYVLSLLPAPLDADPILTDWRFIPSAQLGGDAFGYFWLDSDTFVFYLVDVSGHGVGSAMHSVTVLNVLRQRALPDVDFRDPGSVLSSLNARFQMDSHNGLFFKMWYGVYHRGDRMLECGCAGHHPAYLVPSDKGSAEPLGMPALMIGAMPDEHYEVQRTMVPVGSTVYLFSDGVFEIVTKDEQRWTLSDFVPLILRPATPGMPEPDRLYQAVKQAAKPGLLDDDFSLMTVTFR